MVLLATVATVIASQALISGAFSLVSQAIRLGPVPAAGAAAHPSARMPARSTCRSSTGRCSSAASCWCAVRLQLGAWRAAYGLAVSGVMVITSLAMIPVARRLLALGRACATGLVWGCADAWSTARSCWPAR